MERHKFDRPSLNWAAVFTKSFFSMLLAENNGVFFVYLVNRTQIVGEEGEHADHLTTETASIVAQLP